MKYLKLKAVVHFCLYVVIWLLMNIIWYIQDSLSILGHITGFEHLHLSDLCSMLSRISILDLGQLSMSNGRIVVLVW